MQEDREKSPQPSPEITPAQGGGEQVRSELAAARDELRGVREKKESLQSELSAARNELKGVREGKGALQSELAAARNELKGVREGKESLQSELTAAREELKDVREEKESLQSELKKIRALKVAELQKTRDIIIDPKRIAAVLQPLLRHVNPDVRRAAVGAAGDLGSPLLVFSLIQRLDDPAEGVRSAALVAVRTVTKQNVVSELPKKESSRRVLVRGLRRCWTESGSLNLRLEQE